MKLRLYRYGKESLLIDVSEVTTISAYAENVVSVYLKDKPTVTGYMVKFEQC